jgi:hypothetical protein
MNAAETFAALEHAGARLERHGDRLRCSAPWGTLTTELRQAFRDHRDQLLEMVDRAESCRKSAESSKALSAHLTHSDTTISVSNAESAESFAPPRAGAPAHIRSCAAAPAHARDIRHFRPVELTSVEGQGFSVAESGQMHSADFRQLSALSAPPPGAIALLARTTLAGLVLDVEDDRLRAYVRVTTETPPTVSDAPLLALASRERDLADLIRDDPRPEIDAGLWPIGLPRARVEPLRVRP